MGGEGGGRIKNEKKGEMRKVNSGKRGVCRQYRRLTDNSDQSRIAGSDEGSTGEINTQISRFSFS